MIHPCSSSEKKICARGLRVGVAGGTRKLSSGRGRRGGCLRVLWAGAAPCALLRARGVLAFGSGRFSGLFLWGLARRGSVARILRLPPRALSPVPDDLPVPHHLLNIISSHQYCNDYTQDNHYKTLRNMLGRLAVGASRVCSHTPRSQDTSPSTSWKSVAPESTLVTPFHTRSSCLTQNTGEQATTAPRLERVGDRPIVGRLHPSHLRRSSWTIRPSKWHHPG